MQVVDIPWSDGGEWRYDGDRLAHETGGFFSVVGRRYRSNRSGIDGSRRLMIDQPEVGILGVVLRDGGAGPEMLVQAKAEPGNVGMVQLAPSVQATVSNYTRRHGGAATPYLDLFTAPRAGTVLADSLQSEHGTRFLGKYNRNATVAVLGPGPDPVSDVWRWWPVADVLAVLGESFVVNTDARSALVTSDWSALGPDEPFSRHGGLGFGGELHRSSRVGETDVVAELGRMRDMVELEADSVPIAEFGGHDCSRSVPAGASDGGASVPMLRVSANDREVASWDQPLMRVSSVGSTCLVGQVRDGVLRFQLRGSAEPGFVERVQFGPTTTSAGAPAGTVVAACRQSDEGGRFDRTLADYRIVIAPEGQPVRSGEFTTWVTLGDVRRLLAVPGGCSNELRSTLSLLLAWR